MNKITPVTPYSDDKLEWDANNGQYRLSLTYCQEEFEDTFKDSDILAQRIKKNSRIVYRFISSRVNSYNRLTALSLINKTEEGRRFIFELLRSQFESDVETGYNDLGNATAVNTSTGQIIPREEIARNIVSVATEDEWDNSQLYFGINLGYQGRFPQYYQIALRNL